MADDVTLNAGSGGDVIAADDIGPGVKYQRIKVTLGADGVNDGDVSATNPIPVSGKIAGSVSTITALNGTVSLPCNGASSVIIYVTGTWTATLTFEATPDGGTSWLPVWVFNDGAQNAQQTAGGNALFFANVAGFTDFRVRASAFTTGTVEVKLSGSLDPMITLASSLRSASGTPAFQYVETDDGTIPGNNAHAISVGFNYAWDGSNWIRAVEVVDDDGSLPGGNLVRQVLGLSYAWTGANWERLSSNGSGYLNVVLQQQTNQQTDDDAIGTGLNIPTNIVLGYGFDGTNWERLTTDTNGRLWTIALGDQPVDAPVGTQPVSVGLRASSTEPTPVSASGDGVHAWATLEGSQVVAGFDGTNPQHILVDSGGVVQTNVNAKETDDDVIAGGGTHVSSISLLYGWDGTNWERLSTDTFGNQRVIVAGVVGHDVSLSGVSPVAVAGRANANEPTAVSADGDATFAWMDRLGRLVTVAGHPSPETPVVVNATASGVTQVIGTPGASVSLYIKKMAVNNGGAAVANVGIREAAGSNVWEMDLAADGGGANIDFGDRGWKLTANTALQVDLGAAGDVWVNVLEYYIAA